MTQQSKTGATGKPMKQWTTGGRAVAAALILVSSLSAVSADETWSNTNASGDWATASNWSGSAVPTSADNVSIIGTSSSPVVFSNGGGGSGMSFSAKSIVVDGFELNPTDASHFSVTGNVTIGGAHDAQLSIDGTSSLSAASLNLGGTNDSFNNINLGGSLSVTGMINIGNGADFYDLFTVNSGASLSATGIMINTGGELTFDNFDTFTFTTPVSGNGLLSMVGSGTTILKGDGSNFTGEISVYGGSNGTLDIADASYYAKTSEYNISNPGTLEISVSGTTASSSFLDIDLNGTGIIGIDAGITWTHAGTVVGIGASTLEVGGPGTMILTGDGSAFDGNLVENGALLEIANNASLGKGDFTQQVGVFGGELRVDKGGTFAAGQTIVHGGGLVTINGDWTSLDTTYIFVQGTGATLTGSGTIAGANGAQVTIGNGSLTGKIGAGNLVPLNAPSVNLSDIGNLTINGGLTLNSDATMIVKIAGTTHGNNATLVPGTDYDHFAVSNTAALNGTLVVQAGSGVIQPGDKFNFITAQNGISGTFTAVNVLNNALAFTQDIEDSGTNYDLVFQATQTSFTGFAGTPNQYSVATGLDQLAAIDGAAPLITALNSIPGTALPDAFNQISPQSLQVFGHIAFDNAAFNSQLLANHLANLRDGQTGFDGSQLTYSDPSLSAPLSQIKGRLLAWNPAATPGLASDIADPLLAGIDMKDSKGFSSAADTDPWSTFIAGNVVLADLSSTADLSHQDYTTGSVTAGADYRLTPHLTVGAQVAYGHTDASLDNIGSKATVDTYSPGVYASYVDGGWYGSGSFNYGYCSDTEDRNIQIGALNGTNHGATQGNQYTGNLTGGYEFQKGGWKFGPVASAQYVNLSLNSFTETGPSALAVNEQNANSLRSQLGFEARYAVRCGSTVLTPHASASWQHEFLDDSRGITSQFNGSGAGSFTVATSAPERDSAFMDVGLNAEVTHSLTLFTDYSAQVGQAHFFAQSIQAGLKIGF